MGVRRGERSKFDNSPIERGCGFLIHVKRTVWLAVPFLFSKRNEPMKRPILTVAIMLATSTPVFAQNTEREKQRWLP